MKKRVVVMISLAVGPIIAGVGIGLVANLPILYIISAVYALMLFVMIPSDVFSKSSLDYAIKSVNPSYKKEPLDIHAGTKEQLINFLIVTVMLIICLISIYFFDR
ncbi:hypothetical protein GIX45_16295 [Erwinia sp. CPCC 100877]|nr:hypothetical protein [Erwinia sp. CPCC 100877]